MTTGTKERPIIMGAEEVRGILAGRKTVTRRALNPQPVVSKIDGGWNISGIPHFMGYPETHIQRDGRFKCPYGLPGQMMWVREKWGYEVGQIWCPGPIPKGASEDVRIVYAADEEGFDEDPAQWCSPLFLPRWASRLTLGIVSIRVERLQEITEGDAIAEGWPKASGDFDSPSPGNGGPFDWYRTLWDSLSGKKPGCAWSDNPFVWRIEFRRVEQGGTR